MKNPILWFDFYPKPPGRASPSTGYRDCKSQSPLRKTVMHVDHRTQIKPKETNRHLSRFMPYGFDHGTAACPLGKPNSESYKFRRSCFANAGHRTVPKIKRKGFFIPISLVCTFDDACASLSTKDKICKRAPWPSWSPIPPRLHQWLERRRRNYCQGSLVPTGQEIVNINFASIRLLKIPALRLYHWEYCKATDSLTRLVNDDWNRA
jgi:hypothetical protein